MEVKGGVRTEILHSGPSMSPWPMSIRGIRRVEVCCVMVGDMCMRWNE